MEPARTWTLKTRRVSLATRGSLSLTTWLDIFLCVWAGHHVQVDSLPHIFLHVLHTHKRVHPDAPQETHTGLLTIEAQQEPHRALVLPPSQHVEDVWYSSGRAGKSYGQTLQGFNLSSYFRENSVRIKGFFWLTFP